MTRRELAGYAFWAATTAAVAAVMLPDCRTRKEDNRNHEPDIFDTSWEDPQETKMEPIPVTIKETEKRAEQFADPSIRRTG